MASSDFSDLTQSGSSSPHRERRDGWCGGVHFPIYPNIYELLTTPGLSKSACRLIYWLYQPRFPSPVLVSSQIWALPSNFPSCPRTVSWLGCVAPLAGTTLCRFSNHGTPGPRDCLRAYQLPKTWGVPSLATPPSMLTWQAGATGPFLGCPCPRYCPRGHWRPGPRIMRAHLCPLRYPGPSLALGLPRPTSPVPGIPTK